MSHYSEEYLKKHFDDFEFFNPECRDKRIREVWMRTKHCHLDPGFEAAKMHPSVWLEGRAQRRQENLKLSK